MGERGGSRSADPVEVTEAFAVARELLQGATQEADRTRADADRYARQREQEAELLVAKARRLLAAAEEKAALIIATARAQAPAVAAGEGLALDDLASAPPPPPAPLPLDAERPVAAVGRRSAPTELDRMLASAIAHAVEAALPADPPR
jgi:hypothetical protein